MDLPYYAIYTVTQAMVGTTNKVEIRLNSIYDPIVGVDVDRQPQGRDLWAGAFQFYRVLSSDVKLTLMTNETSGTASIPADDTYVWGYELIEQGGTVSNGTDMFMMTKHAKRQLISKTSQSASGNGTATNFNSTNPNASELTFHYEPAMWDYHVQEVGLEERWTPIGANPSNFHYMALRIHGLNGQTITANRWNMMVQISYTVQFREAKASLLKTLDTEDATYNDAEGNPDT